MFRIILLSSALLMHFMGFAQHTNCHIRGEVIDEHGHELPGALVKINNTLSGDVADGNGKFELEFPCTNRLELQISFIGFGTLDTLIQLSENSSKIIQFILEAESAHLHQLVVEDQRHQEHATIAHDELNQNELKKNGEGTLIKGLESIPGVQSINVGVGISKPVLRGLSMSRVAVNQNGVRQEGQQWGSDHGLEMDPFSAEKVEVVKGPSILKYGSGSSAGVINILPATIAPLDTLHGEFSALYKTNNQHIGGSGKVKWNKNNWFGFAQVSGQSFGDYVVPADSFVYNQFELPIANNQLVNTGGQERAISTEFGKTAKWGTSRITYSYYELEAGLFPGAVGIPRSYSVAPDGNTRDIDLPAQLVKHHKLTNLSDIMLPNNTTQFQLILSAQQNQRREFALPHAHGSILTDSLALALDLTTATVQTHFKHYQTEGVKHEFGFQGFFQLNDIAGFEFLIPAYQSFELGSYYVLDYEINTSTQLNFGVRLGLFSLTSDEAIVKGTADANSQGIAIRSQKMEKQLLNWSSAVGLTHSINKWKTLRVNLNKSFRNPSIAELASNGIHHGTFRHEKGNQNINQENGYHFDVGMEHKKNGIALDATAFSSLYTDFIYLKPSSSFSPLPEGGQLFEYTQNDAYFIGSELAVKWKISETIKYQLAGDYVFNQNLQTGLALPFTPPARIQNQVFVSPFKTKKLELELRAGSQFVFAQNRTDRNEPKTPAYHLLKVGINLTAKTRAFGEIQLDVGLQNVLNTPYFNHLSRYRYLNIPEQGRNLVINLTVPFGI